MFCAPEMIGNVSWALVSCKILSMFHSGGVLLGGLCQYHDFRTPTRKMLSQLNSTNMNVFADVLSLPIWLVTSSLIDNRHHYHIVMPMANAQRRTLAPQREEKLQQTAVQPSNSTLAPKASKTHHLLVVEPFNFNAPQGGDHHPLRPQGKPIFVMTRRPEIKITHQNSTNGLAATWLTYPSGRSPFFMGKSTKFN